MNRLRWIAKRVVLVVFILALTSCLGFGWIADAAISLTIGWMRHVRRVVPHIHVGTAGVATLVVCLVATVALGHSCSAWLWRATPRPGRWQMRWTLAGVVLLVVMFTAGIAATGVVHQTGWLIASREPLTHYSHWDRANPIGCKSNLRQIHQALTLYVKSHGNWPMTLSELKAVDEDYLANDAVECPTHRFGRIARRANDPVHNVHECYRYFPTGLRVTGLTAPLQVTETGGHHKSDGAELVNVLLVDGTVLDLRGHEAVQLLEAVDAAVTNRTAATLPTSNPSP